MNQFIVNAIAEKISSLKTVDYLEERAKEGSKEHALSMLKRAPNTEPAIEDKL